MENKGQCFIAMDIPASCGKCIFYYESRYNCHHDTGIEAKCLLKFMKGDMRDKTFRYLKYPECKLSANIIFRKDN